MPWQSAKTITFCVLCIVLFPYILRILTSRMYLRLTLTALNCRLTAFQRCVSLCVTYCKYRFWSLLRLMQSVFFDKTPAFIPRVEFRNCPFLPQHFLFLLLSIKGVYKNWRFMYKLLAISAPDCMKLSSNKYVDTWPPVGPWVIPSEHGEWCSTTVKDCPNGIVRIA